MYLMMYLMVNREKLSICLDSDVGYYHHYEIGEIIESIIDDSGSITLLKPYNIKDPKFVIDWDLPTSTNMSISKLIVVGYLINATTIVRRQNLIDQIIK